MSENDYELNEVIHATLLNPYLSKETFQLNCELITKYNINTETDPTKPISSEIKVYTKSVCFSGKKSNLL